MNKVFTMRKDVSSKTIFTAKKDEQVLTLEIYDVIGPDFFSEGITASGVSDAIATAGEFDSISLRINSPGGDLFEGVAIYNLLRASSKPVAVFVDGLAASAASLIAMAGDSITMGEGTQMMIHRAMGGAIGYADDMRKLADILDSVSASAADLYVSKTGLSKDAVMSLMTAETWMNPEQAVANKFATAVSKDKAKTSNAFNLSVFKNTPEHLQAPAPVETVNEPDPLIDILRKKLALLKG